MSEYVDPDLTDAEVDRICDGLAQNAAKCRYLQSLGLRVSRKPNGRPLVNRKHYDAIRGGAQAATMAEGRADGIQWSVR